MPTRKNTEENPLPSGALRITLDGDKVTLRDMARLLTATDKLLRTIAKDVAPGTKIDWIVTEASIDPPGGA